MFNQRLTDKMARMTDVAKRSGVSESTVSHVINGTRAVARETRENRK
jgi:DNA-binding LacI/PurR family transcriptional regulator